MNDISELLKRYVDQNRLYYFEGNRGVSNLKKIVTEVCGYNNSYGGTLDNFFEDNPGAIDAVVEWIGNQRSTEWKENLKGLVGASDDTSDPDDDDSEEDES